ncbi:MAG: S41 family peptidase [Dehalococcoidia bacterium]
MEKAVRWSLIGFLVVLIVGLAFSLGFVLRVALEDDGGDGTTASRLTTAESEDEPEFAVLGEIYRALRDNYVDPNAIDPELLRTGAINGMINALGDTHQVYLTKEARQFGDTDLQGQFEGIGATVDQRGGEIVIGRPFDGSPAQKVGIRPGDAILEVDGQSTKGWTTHEAVGRIRGERGTEVRLKVRHMDNTEEELVLVRDRILLPSVRVEVPQDAQGNDVPDLAYIRIEQFTQRTTDELKIALRDMRDRGQKGLILDLRNNPGGLVSACNDVASQFMARNNTIFIEQRRGGDETKHVTASGGLATDIPMTVLVNHNSASCSEIIAGSLKDNGRAPVIGETTLGKGTVNRFVDLKQDGGAIYVTIGRFLTPKRDVIEARGVKPSIEARAADNEDPQAYYNGVMYRAVDYLRNGS